MVHLLVHRPIVGCYEGEGGGSAVRWTTRWGRQETNRHLVGLHRGYLRGTGYTFNLVSVSPIDTLVDRAEGLPAMFGHRVKWQKTSGRHRGLRGCEYYWEAYVWSHRGLVLQRLGDDADNKVGGECGADLQVRQCAAVCRPGPVHWSSRVTPPVPPWGLADILSVAF